MKTSLEKKSPISQILTVEVTADVVEKSFQKTLKEMREEVKMPGFRKGKAPDQMIIKRLGKDLENEAVREIVKSTYPEAIKESGAKPLAEPSFEPISTFERNKPFTYKAHFEVYPEIEIKDYEGLKLEREKTLVTDEDVEREIKTLQHQMTQLEPVPDGELGPGMIAMIDFKGTAGGQTFEGNEAQNYVVDFGSGKMLQEFEVKIQGMKANEERNITFNYPADYFKKEVAGKEGAFSVKMKELRRKIIPEIGDEFAKEIGDFKTIAEVREDLKKRIGEIKELIATGHLRDSAVRLLIEKHKNLEVPGALVEAELKNMFSQLEKQLKEQGKTIESAKIVVKEFVDSNLEEAKNRAKGYMVIDAISRKEKIEAADAEVEKRIEEIAAQNKQPPAKVKEYFEKNNLTHQMKSQLVFEKTLDFVISKAKISEVKPKKEKK